MVYMYKLVTRFDKLGHVVFDKIREKGETLYLLTDCKGTFWRINRNDVFQNQAEIENVKVSGNRIIPYNVNPQVDTFMFDLRFNKVYKELYDSEEYDSYYYEALDAGDKLIKKYPELIKSLVISRGDIFSSDREVAAMVMALNGLKC